MILIITLRKLQQAESLMEIAKLMNRIDILTSGHSKDLAGLDNRIDKEIANLLATYERYRNDVIKYAAGLVFLFLMFKVNVLESFSIQFLIIR